MNYDDHIRAASEFLSAEELLLEAGLGMAAAECVWGAAVQVIDAIYHLRLSRHPGGRDRRETVIRMRDKHQVGEDILDGYRIVQTNLHNHFYTGRLSAQELAASLETGRTFVNTMLELAERERAG